ncbi:hypothetical protein B5C34_00515 [Pacificimonas flava]|uniref:Phosphatidic acid phosphatase type 2/haloperoxidase domain-containing protein n=2 Tax=Pacificimonas TaxID=1960290 RepID=A0A219B1T2_9SPHN|nr:MULTISPECIES: phosphatase PAP2 family protein [Pacificimonas]MBZ6378305.1 phosphatase PAP2 family protein [Pacificimonas aurantium]OWV32083.1 hypothetical protein B5C34_00515 [Pacificimonas flava]
MSEHASSDGFEAAAEGQALLPSMDLEVARQAEEISDTPGMGMAAAASELADQPPLIILSLLTALGGAAAGNRRLARTGIRMLAAHGLATLAKDLIKNRVDRSRPFKAASSGRHEFRPGQSDRKEDRSFPSGHSAGGIAVARAIGREYPAVGRPASAAALLAAAIQVPREAHYASDVLAGLAIGAVSEAVVDIAFGKLGEEPERAIARQADKLLRNPD